MSGFDGQLYEASRPCEARLTHAARVSHAYIADGQAAGDLAATAVCSGGAGNDAGKACGHCRDCKKASQGIHPDITRIDILKDKRAILVDQIRGIKTDVYIAPNEAARKVYIVDNADTMNTNAQNAFLQMLEEPPAHAVFILKTANPAALLPTVRSRCVDLKTRPELAYGRGPGGDADDANEISELAGDFVEALDDNMLLTKCMFRLERLDKPSFDIFIASARGKLALALRGSARRDKVFMADDLLTKAADMLELNVNTGHISGMIVASLITIP